jgi:methionyl-tRNA formyltransferase
MGTAEFAVPTLQRLVQDDYPVTVVSQPDMPGGRGQRLQSPPVKRKALELNLAIHQPATLKNDDARRILEGLSPDCIVVVAYGRILPSWLIRLPRYGVVNLHGSLLPKYRGAAPIQWAMANGESETGVCTMQIDEGLDTGPVYLCQTTPIAPEESVQQLSERLSLLGSALVIRTIQGIAAGSLQATPQNHAAASLAPILRKEDGFIHWNASAQTIHNRIRAFNPWPGAVTQFRGVSCRILKSRLDPSGGVDSAAPGEIAVSKGSLSVSCGGHSQLQLLEVQLPGRKPVSGSDFVNGMRLQSGERFGPGDGQHT